jgi:hypothetical protein
VSDLVFRLTTDDEQRKRYHRARWDGDVCAACGREIGGHEAVYVERFVEGTSYTWAPVGSECASPELLERASGEAPERCVGCGRSVYYRTPNAKRRRASCSKRCLNRDSTAKRQRKTPAPRADVEEPT